MHAAAANHNNVVDEINDVQFSFDEHNNAKPINDDDKKLPHPCICM